METAIQVELDDRSVNHHNPAVKVKNIGDATCITEIPIIDCNVVLLAHKTQRVGKKRSRL